MSSFIIIFLLVYGGWNAYVGWSVARCHPWRRPWAHWIWAGWVALMVAGPILVRLLERRDAFHAAQALAWPAYIWMGVAFWAGGLFLLADLWNGLVKLGGLMRPSLRRLSLRPRRRLIGIGAMLALMTLWGFVEARQVRLVTVRIPTARLAAGSAPIRVAQISDVHVSVLQRAGTLRHIAALVQEARPDLVVSTGDLLDGSAVHLNHLASIFEPLDPPLGKFAVTGNHEWYAGLSPSLAFHREAGFRVLRAEPALLDGGRLWLAGVDDPAGGKGARTDEDRALPPEAGSRPLTLLLKHQPTIDGDSLGRYDLQLSGHTHRGQIFPFNWLVRLRYRYIYGLYEVGGDSRLYVSPGSGAWGPPLRLRARPQVTLVIFEPDPVQGAIHQGPYR